MLALCLNRSGATPWPYRHRVTLSGLVSCQTSKSPDCAPRCIPLRFVAAVRDLTNGNFGILIAYVLPGAVALWGVSYFSPAVTGWLGRAASNAPTVGGFLYVTLAAVGAGLTASTVRWMVVDTVHHLTGIPRPRWDFSQFDQKVAGYDKLGEVHYKYYEFYGDVLVSLVFSWFCRRLALGFWSAPLEWLDLAFLVLGGIFFAGSRDTFRTYNQRLEMLLGTDDERRVRRHRRKRKRRAKSLKSGALEK